MNTSYDSAADGMLPMVEAFPYHDTLGPKMPSDARTVSAGQAPEEKTAKNEKAPRLSPEEISRLISEAHAEGLALGASQSAARFEEELALGRKRVADLLFDFQQQRRDYYSKVELELVHLALAIAAKILHREAQVDRMVVAGLVKVMIDRLQQKTNIIVRVRPEDAEAWRHSFHTHANVQVVEDSALEPKACLLETELGIADMGLHAQLKEVEQGFFDLLAQRPGPK
jgi:flagellar biosynthesis/type III secretory pathway protein FliH